MASRSPAQDSKVLRRAAVLFGLTALSLFPGCDFFRGSLKGHGVGRPASDVSSSPHISLSRPNPGDHHFIVANLSPAAVDALKKLPPGDESWNDWFSVYTGNLVDSDILPMLGDYRLESQRLVFVPRFPLRKGGTYTAEWRDQSTQANGEPIGLKTTFTLPASKQTPPAAVVAVYPTRDVLPENQLKFYLHFSAPMSRGEAYRRIHLLKASGEEVEFPFLELGEELWDDSGTRFTLFFDPGRIKRGLKPREEVGPSLVEGESYKLVIDKEWLDAQGRPLEKEFRKEFKTAAPDDVQPDVAKWKVAPGKSGTTEPLIVEFNEPLDHAMLERVLSVVDAAGKTVAGEVKIDQNETCWSFTPQHVWTPGAYQLVADAALEDLAGNSLAKPFEVDVFNKVDHDVKTESVRIDFRVNE